MTVFLLHHVRPDGDRALCQFTGIFTTREKAEGAAKWWLRVTFNAWPEGYPIDEWKLDDPNHGWQEGFSSPPVRPLAGGDVRWGTNRTSFQKEKTEGFAYPSKGEGSFPPVYLLSHEHTENGMNRHTKYIGVFSTWEKAEEAREAHLALPGFREWPDGFYLKEAMVDDRFWDNILNHEAVPRFDRESLRSALQELASREEQERLWTGLTPGVMASFVETIEAVFRYGALGAETDAGVLGERYGDMVEEKVARLSEIARNFPQRLGPGLRSGIR